MFNLPTYRITPSAHPVKCPPQCPSLSHPHCPAAAFLEECLSTCFKGCSVGYRWWRNLIFLSPLFLASGVLSGDKVTWSVWKPAGLAGVWGTGLLYLWGWPRDVDRPSPESTGARKIRKGVSRLLFFTQLDWRRERLKTSEAVKLSPKPWDLRVFQDTQWGLRLPRSWDASID